MKPDLSKFNEHIREADFQTGLDKGKWGIKDDNFERPTWPNVFIWIKTAQKPNAPDRYYFKFDLTGYPEQAPTACPWDINSNQRLPDHLWPRGNKFVSTVFKPGWKPIALYAPCDRIAIEGHPQWSQQYPDLYWKSSFKITKYVQFIHRLLNSADYVTS